MKVLKPNKNNFLDSDDDIKNKNIAFNNQRTPFWKSLLFLISESALPIVAIWLLSSPDFAQRVFKTEWYVGFAIGMIALGVCSIFTIGTYFCNAHEVDQFTFNYGLFGVGFSFYLSSFWFNTQYFLYQSLIAFAFLLLFLMLGTMLGVLIKNWRLKIRKPKATPI